MTILKALKKINTLTKCELKHCIQRMDTETAAKYGIPYVMRLEEKRQKFIDRLKQL